MGKVPPAIKRAGETLVADVKILNEVVGKLAVRKLCRFRQAWPPACLTDQAIKRDEGKARSEGRSAVESRPAKVGCFLQISFGPLAEEQPSIAGLVPAQCGVFRRRPVPCGAMRDEGRRSVAASSGDQVTTTVSMVFARDHALRTITTAALFASINTNSKSRFDDGCSSSL
jgi:hypothetical protein